VLLDEPLASLDRGLKRNILPFLCRIRQRFALPMLIVSHDLEDLLSLTDSIMLIDHGQLRGHGSVADLAQNPDTLELLHDCGLVFAVPGQLRDRDDQGLAWIRPHGASECSLATGNCEAGIGDQVDILIRPEDLVLARPGLEAQLSLTNRIAGTITAITRSAQRCLVSIDAGFTVPLLAEVTERAIERLSLREGDAVLALCKAQALHARPLG
jgi:molybdate transport system ATP-binding protein